MKPTYKIKIDGKIWYEKTVYPSYVESAESLQQSLNHTWGNVTGQTWRDKGGEENKIEFLGGEVSYREWREWQAQKTGIDFFGTLATLENENGEIIDSTTLSGFRKSENAKEKLSDWIFCRLEKNLYYDRHIHNQLWKLANEEREKGN